MMNNNRDDTRKQFNECLVKATDLLRLVSQQIGTNPTYGDLLDIMCLRSELDVLEDSLKEVLDRFQQNIQGSVSPRQSDGGGC